jgi:transmembrane sensor
MSHMVHDDTMNLMRYREAAEWLLRLNEGDASEAEIDQWLRWCQADAENLVAFEKLQQDWQDTAGFKSAPDLLPVSQVDPAHRRRPGLSFGALRSSRAFPWVAAACLVVAVSLGYQFFHRSPVHEVLVAAKQEPATLPDGSSLLLSAKAVAEVDFSGVIRDVVLRPDGEAFIKVHHDTARPFTVRAGDLTVTAVGTAFDVRREADRVTVTVEEGTIVAAAVGGIRAPTQWRVGAGYQVIYSEGLRSAVVSRVDTQSVLRWRDGELAYDNAPLEAVIADINRYSTVNVTVRDPKLLLLHFTGTVFVGSINDWVNALEAKYPLKASLSRDGDIAIDSPIAVGAAP